MKPEDETLDARANRVLDEAETLIWGFLDDSLSEADAKRLELLLSENDVARSRYVECVQLHCDLVDHFQCQRKSTSESPILGSLGMDPVWGPDGMPQAAD